MSAIAYKRRGGFVSGLAAWLKIVVGAILVMGLGWIALSVLAGSMKGFDRGVYVLMDAKIWAYIIGLPLVAMIYYLPWFIDVRKSNTGDGLVMGFICNTLFGWFPPFYMVLMALAIMKNR